MKVRLFPFLEDINLQIMYENMLFIYACLHISTIGDTIV